MKTLPSHLELQLEVLTQSSHTAIFFHKAFIYNTCLSCLFANLWIVKHLGGLDNTNTVHVKVFISKYIIKMETNICFTLNYSSKLY